MKLKDPFKNSNQSTLMEVNGLYCSLNMPHAIKRKKHNGAETVAGLPPYAPRPAFLVDEYPASPDTWMHGSAKASSYFVPILPERGMWLDFTRNSNHTHHVAALISVQGINPLTGRKSDPLRLEQYKARCPVHEVDFQQDLYCPECKYKWHPQNYLASNNYSPFWIDGFRTEDGTIRQWWFTEEECKGVAAQLIGEDRVFAIGIAFYLSKEEKPKPVYSYRSYPFWLGGGYYSSGGFCGGSYSSGISISGNTGPVGPAGVQGCTGSVGPQGATGDVHIYNCSTSCNASANAASSGASGFAPPYKKRRKGKRRTRGMKLGSRAAPEAKADIEAALKSIEIGAGAKIRQTLARDPENLDFWQDEPAGFIYVNYCDVDTAWKIVQAGKREDETEGFLGGLEIKDEPSSHQQGQKTL